MIWVFFGNFFENTGFCFLSSCGQLLRKKTLSTSLAVFLKDSHTTILRNYSSIILEVLPPIFFQLLRQFLQRFFLQFFEIFLSNSFGSLFEIIAPIVHPFDLRILQSFHLSWKLSPLSATQFPMSSGCGELCMGPQARRFN